MEPRSEGRDPGSGRWTCLMMAVFGEAAFWLVIGVVAAIAALAGALWSWVNH